ncbi:MAG TPA: TatD family hydrolase, partial [Actinomycetota bacterium]
MAEAAEALQPVAHMVDTHCHLFLMDGEASAIAAEARAAGVSALVCVGVDRVSSERSRDLADGIAGVFATAGVHPHTASDLDAETGSAIEALLADPRVVGVGETGLDAYRALSPMEDQHRALRLHCALARETGKALVVHVREAWEDAMRILADERAERVVLHCFSGDPPAAREAAQRGYWCSFAGPVTYPKNEDLRRAAAAVPEDRLLVETDSPYLPPQPLRGRENHPANVAAVIRALAEA